MLQGLTGAIRLPESALNFAENEGVWKGRAVGHLAADAKVFSGLLTAQCMPFPGCAKAWPLSAPTDWTVKRLASSFGSSGVGT